MLPEELTRSAGKFQCSMYLIVAVKLLQRHVAQIARETCVCYAGSQHENVTYHTELNVKRSNNLVQSLIAFCYIVSTAAKLIATFGTLTPVCQI